VKTGGKMGRLAWRMGVCALLLGWAFHTIFLSEGRLVGGRRGGDWEALSRLEQWKIGWSFGPVAMLRVLALIRPWEGALSVVFMGATIFLGAWRWHLVLRAHALTVPLGRVAEISLVGHFFNALLLGSTGGDLMKAYYVAGETTQWKAESVVSVFVDRLLGLLSMLVFAALMMVPNLGLLMRYQRLGALALVALAMLAGLLLVGGLSFRAGVSRFWPGARDWLRRLPKGESLDRAVEAMRRFGRQRGLLLPVLAISMLLNLACVLQFWALARGLGLQLEFRVLAVVVPIIICIAALPITPSGLGVRENLYVWILATPSIGVPATAALSLSLLAYAGFLVWSLVGGVAYVRFRRALAGVPVRPRPTDPLPP
jgi:hypothetical protein